MKQKRFARIGRVGAAGIIAGSSALIGMAAWGGVQLSGAAGPPINYGCSTVNGQITYYNGSAAGGLYLNANAGNSKAATVAGETYTNPTTGDTNDVAGTIDNGQTQIGMTGAAVAGETIVINKLNYVVANYEPNQDILAGQPINGTVTLASEVTGLKSELPVGTKLDVLATTNANDDTAYAAPVEDTTTKTWSGGLTASLALTGDGCSINSAATGLDFYPTNGVTVNGNVGPVAGNGNGILGLLAAPAISGTMSYPTDSDYAPTATPNTKNGGLETIAFAKAGAFVGTDYVYSGGTISGDLKSSGEGATVGFDGFTLCTVDQWTSVQEGHSTIADCDGGADSSVSSGAALAGLESLLTGTAVDGSDGSPYYVLAQVDVTGSFGVSS